MKKRAHNSIDRSGQKYNNWTIVSYVGCKNKKAMYLCRCDCGVELIKRIIVIVNGKIKSCGCQNIINHTKHSMSNSSEYCTWQSMKNRCTNIKCDKWVYYGGRGIKVCDRWMNSFDLFLLDVGTKPTTKHSIDRINNNGNYEPQNCKWSTKSEQALNRRKHQPLPNPPTK